MSKLPRDPTRADAQAAQAPGDTREDHEKILAAGWALAVVIEQLIAGDDPVDRRADIDRARFVVMNAIQAPNALTPMALQAYRKTNALRELVDAWIKRGAPAAPEPDLTDLDGVCRIVKRAYRAVRTGQDAAEASSHRTEAGPDAVNQDPDEAPVSAVAERHAANSDQPRTHHHPHGEAS